MKKICAILLFIVPVVSYSFAQCSVTAGSSPASMCAGSTTSLNSTANGAPPFLYSWAPPPNNPNNQNTTAQPTVTTIYTVTITDVNGCTASATTTVFVGPQPSVTVVNADDTICAGESITLQVNVSGQTGFSWSAGQTTNAITVTPASNQIFWATAWNGACVISDSVKIWVGEIPFVTAGANPQTICSGNCVTLTAVGSSPPPPPGLNWTWYPSNSPWAPGYNNTTSTTVVCPQTANPLVFTYSVVAAAMGCTDTASASVFVLPQPCTFSVEEAAADSDIKILPNPSDGYLKIQSDEIINSIEIFNLHGESIYLFSFANPCRETDVIFPTGAVKGIYFIKLKTGKGMPVRKIVLR